jgi:hypothetical protein
MAQDPASRSASSQSMTFCVAVQQFFLASLILRFKHFCALHNNLFGRQFRRAWTII